MEGGPRRCKGFARRPLLSPYPNTHSTCVCVCVFSGPDIYLEGIGRIRSQRESNNKSTYKVVSSHVTRASDTNNIQLVFHVITERLREITCNSFGLCWWRSYGMAVVSHSVVIDRLALLFRFCVCRTETPNLWLNFPKLWLLRDTNIPETHFNMKEDAGTKSVFLAASPFELILRFRSSTLHISHTEGWWETALKHVVSFNQGQVQFMLGKSDWLSNAQALNWSSWAIREENERKCLIICIKKCIWRNWKAVSGEESRCITTTFLLLNSSSY